MPGDRPYDRRDGELNREVACAGLVPSCFRHRSSSICRPFSERLGPQIRASRSISPFIFDRITSIKSRPAVRYIVVSSDKNLAVASTPFLPMPARPDFSRHLMQVWHASARALAGAELSMTATQATEPRRFEGSRSSSSTKLIISENVSRKRP